MGAVGLVAASVSPGLSSRPRATASAGFAARFGGRAAACLRAWWHAALGPRRVALRAGASCWRIQQRGAPGRHRRRRQDVQGQLRQLAIGLARMHTRSPGASRRARAARGSKSARRAVRGRRATPALPTCRASPAGRTGSRAVAAAAGAPT